MPLGRLALQAQCLARPARPVRLVRLVHRTHGRDRSNRSGWGHREHDGRDRRFGRLGWQPDAEHSYELLYGHMRRGHELPGGGATVTQGSGAKGAIAVSAPNAGGTGWMATAIVTTAGNGSLSIVSYAICGS